MSKDMDKIIRTGCTLMAAATMLAGAGCSENETPYIPESSTNETSAETISHGAQTNITTSMLVEYADRLATDLAKDKHDNVIFAEFKAIMPNCMIVNNEVKPLKYTTPIEEFVPQYTDYVQPNKVMDICLVSILANVHTTSGNFEDRFLNVAVNTSVLDELMNSIGHKPTVLSESLASSLGNYDPNDLNYTVYMFNKIDKSDLVDMQHANDNIYNLLLSAYGINVLGENIHSNEDMEMNN